jgi:hypothetical protein
VAGLALAEEQFARAEPLACGPGRQSAQLLRGEAGEQGRTLQNGYEIRALCTHAWILSASEPVDLIDSAHWECCELHPGRKNCKRRFFDFAALRSETV